MRRLEGFDYHTAFFYMVTIKKAKGIAPFSEIVAPGRCQMNAVTKAFVNVIRGFSQACPAVEPIGRFSIMPDHIHLVIKLVPAEPLAAKPIAAATAPAASHSGGGAAKGIAARAALSLEEIVPRLMLVLERAYWHVKAREGNPEAQVMATRIDAGITEGLKPVFLAEWHDWIVKESDQLQSFTRYTRENPMRYWRRKENAKYFNRVKPVQFLGRTWYAYGNTELLDLPMIVPIQCSRKIEEGSTIWQRALAAAGRIGPGGAAISTFMSACEKACGHEVALAGGKFIVLAPENFPPVDGDVVSEAGWRTRWHPYRNHEIACARGDLVYLSLYEPMGRQATKAELYQRCHEMGDFVTAALGGRKWE